MDKLIKTIDEYVKKAPVLPANIKELLVQFAPWGAILTIAISLPTILSIFGLSSYLGAYGFMYGNVGARYMIVIAFLIANMILRGISIPGLFAKSMKGWTFFFYSILLYAVYSIVNYDIIGGLISTLISLYLAFQVKEYYK
jgi:hypothetical protein